MAATTPVDLGILVGLTLIWLWLSISFLRACDHGELRLPRLLLAGVLLVGVFVGLVVLSEMMVR